MKKSAQNNRFGLGPEPAERTLHRLWGLVNERAFSNQQ
uniref:Uncharacterized protein n=1 Tax=Utricularia reniformis TaxID=192314 RepID=A0A1Y0B203_9LAMI|nr:hypothetical protein AEK19_MT1270 [Utricularia reniformis]ART31476.1 hypothetical protein AEK19_MT1270 [Utricularia reniformis]